MSDKTKKVRELTDKFFALLVKEDAEQAVTLIATANIIGAMNSTVNDNVHEELKNIWSKACDNTRNMLRKPEVNN